MRKSALLIRFMLCLSLLIVLSASPWSVALSTAQAASNDSAEVDQLLPLVGSALVDAGQQKWTDAQQELDTFATAWKAIDTSAAPTEANEVNTALTDAQTALGKSSTDPKAATSALGTLARAVNTFSETGQAKSSATSSSTGPSQQGLTAVKVILPLADTTIQHIDQHNWQAAQDSYKQIVNSWPDVENAIRADNFTVYSQLEVKMSMIRVALQADPPREEQAKADTQALITLLNEYAAGDIADTAPASGTVRLSDAVTLLQQVQTAVTNQDQTQASDLMTQFISMWPLVEGEVQISSASTYTAIENEMAEVQGYLVSNPPLWSQANTVIVTMLDELTPLTSKTSYTAWDAAIILLREGLEAILVLAALLAYAKRSGSRTAGNYIWSGAISGLVLSGVMAAIFVYAFSQVSSSGSTREMIEGITGLVAVVMMLSVGHWLHQKANLKNWNTYIENQVSGALERGSLWSLAIVSGLAILREGAETAIFYIGMAPAIALSQLILGIAIALVILIVIAVLIIKFSVKLPIRPFFLTATVLIYYLVFRFLGESIHALQVAGKFPAHTVAGLPSISWIGMYPTWETFIPQMIVLIWMVWRLILPEYRSRKQTA
ncbi:high-affinity iron transporter [Paenibacillus sp. SORGH_AS306]|uniref:FTR1 family iron permease n=1 Tax=unclassified Paenibacillus TaxID=185978 RepID=UPI002788E7A8|nr:MULTISPECIES: FTR1 family protein [unclassified Paenibacillus]MDQ1235425.1 high-affinity iron transporter [Paenibacillus sp. SORGH_AS_0306]MDR6112474.1 high-affinity iron transporter [Paenibacillus sp. SORGH_AS_0338]